MREEAFKKPLSNFVKKTKDQIKKQKSEKI